jgi:hypothetical protein
LAGISLLLRDANPIVTAVGREHLDLHVNPGEVAITATTPVTHSNASAPPSLRTDATLPVCGGRILGHGTVVTIDEVAAFARTLPRTNEGLVRGQMKFRIGRIVYLALSRDGSTMGFAFPKELRDALIESDPERFTLPRPSDLRYHWVHVLLASIDEEEMRELVEDAWAFTVPKHVIEEYVASKYGDQSG